MAGNRSKGRANPLPPRSLDQNAAAAFALLKQQFRDSREETPDPGFYTIKEWAEVWKIGLTTAREMLLRGVDVGTVIAKTFNRSSLSGRKAVKVTHYKVKTDQAKSR